MDCRGSQYSAHSIHALVTHPAGRAEEASMMEMSPDGGARRRSRPLQRKTSHSLIERRRRDKINEGLVSLQRLVPACREELRETLKTKAYSNKKNANKDPADVDDDVERQLEDKIGSQMVLEKLCIISHSVDHIQENQQEITALKRLLTAERNTTAAYKDAFASLLAAVESISGRNAPEAQQDKADLASLVSSYKQTLSALPSAVQDVSSRHITDAHDSAHFEEDADHSGEHGEEEAEDDGEAVSSNLSDTPPDCPELVPSTPVRSTPVMQAREFAFPQPPQQSWTRCQAKCQRHWGSERPVKLTAQGRQQGGKRRASSISDKIIQYQNAIGGFERASPASQCTPLDRAHSVDGETEDVACDNPRTPSQKAAKTTKSAPESDDSDLELDTWESARHASQYGHARNTSIFTVEAPRKRSATEAALDTTRSLMDPRRTYAERGGNFSAMDVRTISESPKAGCKDCAPAIVGGPTPVPLASAEPFVKRPRALSRAQTGLGLLADLSSWSTVPTENGAQPGQAK